ncbi:MAG: MotA/TolQ/ExbB proton channel family protein [Oscillatoriales cyanobacterium SM2_1_8]|nr:MotA/TolQ/ExbB proton channel family protein [Oscillatoriales cyanobacterium SM2_1_8]
MTLFELFVKGGITMYPLLLFSVALLVMVVERGYFWTRLGRQQPQLVRQVFRTYRNSPVEAQQQLESQRNLPISRIFLAALELEDPDPDEFRLALESSAQAEIPLLKRFATALDAIATLAPLLGLLGTVTGLMESFAAVSLGDFSPERTGQVSGGIGEALITTATGLIVAIVAAGAGSIFRGLYQNEIAFLQEWGGRLELIYRHHHLRPAAGDRLAVAPPRKG